MFEVTRICDQIQKFYDRKTINELATELGFIKRRGKLDALDFILNIMLALDKDGASCSLSDIGHQFYKNLGVELRDQSINERFNDRAVDFCSMLYHQALRYRLCNHVDSKILDRFQGIYVEDSTNISLPPSLCELYKGYGAPASKSALKINFRMDMQSTALHFRLKSAVNNDQNGLTMGVEKGSLWIRDLGYFKHAEFKGIDASQGYFISRLQSRGKAYISADCKEKAHLDLLKLKDDLKEGEVFEQQVYLGAENRWAARIVVIKLPAQKAKAKIEKMKRNRKKKGKKLSQRLLDMAPINVFITNLPKALCTADMLWALYTVRWQIELMFKAWKTNYRIDEIKKTIKPQRALCQFYIQMIQIILTCKLFRYLKVKMWKFMNKELSQIKGIKKIKSWFNDILVHICKSSMCRSKMAHIIHRMIDELSQSAYKNRNRANANNFFKIC